MIHSEDIFKKIGFILNDLQDQQEYLAHYPEKINAPELELFLANANFLADHIKIYVRLKTSEGISTVIGEPAEEQQLNTLPEKKEVELPAEKSVHATNIPVEIAAEIEENESRIDLQPAETILLSEIETDSFKPDTDPAPFEFILDQESTDDKFDFEERSVEEIFDRKLTDDEQAVINAKKALLNLDAVEEEENDDDEIGPEPFLIPVADEAVAPAIIASPVIDEPVPLTEQLPEPPKPIEKSIEALPKPTLNELLAQKTGVNLNASARKVSITDLKQAINLNDKLLFIKDLFNGYNLAYAEAIDLLNKMSDFAAADSFLQKNYAMKNSWSEKQGTVDRFYEILNQRFPL